MVALSTFGVLAIGTINLWVSFSLALFVALRSRQVSFRHGLPLLKSLCSRFLKKPAAFFVPPKTTPEQNGAEPS